jgi:signal peptidase I
MFWSKFSKGVVILITALSGWSIGRAFNSSILVEGASMEPTFHSGEIISCNRFIPGHVIPRGTIVMVSRFPGLPCIKRVVGLPNETVSFHFGEIFINGKMLLEPYIPDQVTTYSWERSSLSTKDDQYVLLGDNRAASEDSRSYGPISRSQIIGTVDLSSPQAELLDNPRYRIKVTASLRASGTAE